MGARSSPLPCFSWPSPVIVLERNTQRDRTVIQIKPEIDYFLPKNQLGAQFREGLSLTFLFETRVKIVAQTHPFALSLNSGNVRVVEIDGPVVRLELEGACGSCPSSTMTMKMGLERRLVQRIPEISEVVQSIPDGPELNVRVSL